MSADFQTIGFALSKWPYFHSAYVLEVFTIFSMTVSIGKSRKMKFEHPNCLVFLLSKKPKWVHDMVLPDSSTDNSFSCILQMIEQQGLIGEPVIHAIWEAKI